MIWAPCVSRNTKARYNAQMAHETMAMPKKEVVEPRTLKLLERIPVYEDRAVTASNRPKYKERVAVEDVSATKAKLVASKARCPPPSPFRSAAKMRTGDVANDGTRAEEA